MNFQDKAIKQTELTVILVLWMLILLTPLYLFQQNGELEWEKIVNNWMSIFPFFILFMINHFVLVPFLLFKRKKTLYFISAISLLLVFSFVSPLFDGEQSKRNTPPAEHFKPHHAQLPPPHLQPPPRKNHPPYPPFIIGFILGLLILASDTGLRMMFRWSDLEKEKSFLEKESVKNQLAFLQNQVSPHFFMNTLNNIHALIDVNAEEAKEAIIKLSKLMRHLLYESDAEKIALSSEMEFIKSYVNLMKLRFSEKVQVQLNIPNDYPDKKIPPLLFTSFVENAFKHGISYQNTSFINISFHITKDQLQFEIKNSIPKIKKEEYASGIGIVNSRKRLNILFGENYSLAIKDIDDKYQLNLNIPL